MHDTTNVGNFMCPVVCYSSCMREELNLPDYDKRKLGKQAQEFGFVLDMLAQVYRLIAAIGSSLC